jgi:hypothetical protein
MWKWVLVAVGAVVAIGIFAFMMIAVTDPQGMVDFFMNLDDEIDVDIDGKKIEVKIDKFDEGLGPADRSFLVKKMLVFYARLGKDSKNIQLSQEYNRALAKAAEDHKLTREENSLLREMFKDVVSEDDVNNWMKEFKELEESEKQGDIKL